MKCFKVFKRTISVMLVFITLMCFAFNTFGLDMVSKTYNPQIEIDGSDVEVAWIDSSRIIFDISQDIGSWLSVEMFNYQNSIYGMVAFNDAVESDNDLVVRIDFHYEKYKAYVIFVMQKQLVLFESDSLIFEGVIQEDIANYRAEFSLSGKQSSAFSQGDLVQIEIKYGCVGEIDDYTKMFGFYEREILDCYIGGQYIEDVEAEAPKTTKATTTKTTKPKTTKTTKAKTTKEKTTKATTTTIPTNQGNSGGVNRNETTNDSIIGIDDTKFIFISLGGLVIVMSVIAVGNRKNKGKEIKKYTDDDKGCD